MPTINLNIPSNSLFHSSLNEIDLAVRAALVNQMRITDPRSIKGKQDIVVAEGKDNWLWDDTRIFQVDELTTECIFDTYLLRKKINNKKGVDVSYPLLGFMQNDIDTVFWGTGNRYRQWNFELPSNDTWEIGDEVVITSREKIKWRGSYATIVDKRGEGLQEEYKLAINGTEIRYKTNGMMSEPIWFNKEDLKQTGDKIATTYKAKAMTCTYTAVILCDNRDELQYIRDKHMLRTADAHIWFKYASPTIKNAENQIFTVFGIPNIERYPLSEDKLNGHGYIYGTTFDIAVWGCLTDEPLPQNIIEAIRMSIQVEGDQRHPRIIIGQ